MAVSPKLIKQLQAEFSKIDRINPDSPAYKRMILLLSLLSQSQLKIVADANIKFVSLLAQNRLKKSNAGKEESSMSILNSLEAFAAEEALAPSAVILAQTVEKVRNGDQFTTFELASVLKRLATSELSEVEIADRFNSAFRDVLITD